MLYFIKQINVIFMPPLYEAVILCHCIINADNIRILHGCAVRIENSVQRVTVWHPEAMPSDAKQLSRGTEFSIRTERSSLILFLTYLSISNVLF